MSWWGSKTPLLGFKVPGKAKNTRSTLPSRAQALPERDGWLRWSPFTGYHKQSSLLRQISVDVTCKGCLSQCSPPISTTPYRTVISNALPAMHASMPPSSSFLASTLPTPICMHYSRARQKRHPKKRNIIVIVIIYFPLASLLLLRDTLIYQTASPTRLR